MWWREKWTEHRAAVFGGTLCECLIEAKNPANLFDWPVTMGCARLAKISLLRSKLLANSGPVPNLPWHQQNLGCFPDISPHVYQSVNRYFPTETPCDYGIFLWMNPLPEKLARISHCLQKGEQIGGFISFMQVPLICCGPCHYALKSELACRICTIYLLYRMGSNLAAIGCCLLSEPLRVSRWRTDVQNLEADFQIKGGGGGMIHRDVYSATALHKDRICTGCQHSNNLYLPVVFVLNPGF